MPELDRLVRLKLDRSLHRRCLSHKFHQEKSAQQHAEARFHTVIHQPKPQATIDSFTPSPNTTPKSTPTQEAYQGSVNELYSVMTRSGRKKLQMDVPVAP